MKKELREYLQTIGLRSAATEKDAWAFYKTLEGDQRSQAREIRGTRQSAGGGGNDDGDEDDQPVSGQRSATDQVPVQPTPEQIAQRAVNTELQRQTDIREQFNGEFPELQQRAIDERWTIERSASEILSAIRNARSDPASGSPGIHTRGGNASQETLQAAMLLRAGVALDNPAFGNTNAARSMNLPRWMRQDVNAEQRQLIMDQAHELGPQSMVDLCRHALIANGQQVPHNRDEMIRSAISTRSLEPVFTTNINARLLASYSVSEDTTNGWTMPMDLDDFKENELVTMGKTGRLTRHGRGKTADNMDRGADMEPMRIYRYSGQAMIDEIDIINNRLGNPESDTPEEMGRSAKQTEIDLVYAVLLANANLIKDDTALFSGTNDQTGAASVLSVTALEVAVQNMMGQRERGQTLNIRSKYVLVAPALKFALERILGSNGLLNTTSGTLTGSSNPISAQGLIPVVDDRLSTAGVVDPYTGNAIAGNDSQWFVTADPGVGGAKTIAKGFRTGTGRMPQVRSFTMDRGTWGIGWDINHDVGAKAIDRLAMSRHASDQ